MPTYGVSSSYVRQAGIGNAASYQVSGRPFLTGNLDIDNDVEDKIVFPAVTKRIVIQNMADVTFIPLRHLVLMKHLVILRCQQQKIS